MKKTLGLLFLGVAILIPLLAVYQDAQSAPALQSYSVKVPFDQVVYFEHGGKGSLDGTSAGNAVAIADGDLWAIPAQTVIEKVYVVIDTAVAGTTNFDVGDDDDADGFVDGSLSVTLGTAGMYGWDVFNAGAYLQNVNTDVSAGASLVIADAKYYSASGKEVKLDTTTASTAGKGRVIIHGYFLGSNS